MPEIEFRHVKKVYRDKVVAVDDFNLVIPEKEFVVLIGPSGCGKSTTLRMIAGLEEVTEGEILIDGMCMNEVEAKDRDVAMVFQNYALYPHMSVYENLAFPLKIRKMPEQRIKEQVLKTVRKLDLSQYLDRKPKEISGGQCQRVALGRAMIHDSQIFLLDEPLSNLDAKLRAAMRMEIIRLYKSLDATFIYVTHDQTEAMTMGTCIVVMKDGVVQQIGTPQEVYDEPENLFVATFIGTPQMNTYAAILKKEGFLDMGGKLLPIELSQDACAYIDREVIFGFRADSISVDQNGEIAGCVEMVERMGAVNNVYLVWGKNRLVIQISSKLQINPNDYVSIRVLPDKIYLFDIDTHERIR